MTVGLARPDEAPRCRSASIHSRAPPLHYDVLMSDRVVVHLPAMPQPKDFGLDVKTPADCPAADRYAKALEVWERVVNDIAKRIGKKK